ncbi:unnamed protein product [Closterium sp. Naga37s-1]|nr:unnamed protein product [Closterium sp. Naga37s-1]
MDLVQDNAAHTQASERSERNLEQFGMQTQAVSDEFGSTVTDDREEEGAPYAHHEDLSPEEWNKRREQLKQCLRMLQKSIPSSLVGPEPDVAELLESAAAYINYLKTYNQTLAVVVAHQL